MPKRSKFPLIRKTWPLVRLYRERPALFSVDGRRAGAGRKEYFADKKRALARADQLATELVNRGTEALNFSTADRVMALECIGELRPFNRTLRDAVHHYVSWLKSEEQKHTSPLIKDCLAQYLAAREQEAARGDLSQRSVRETKHFVNRLSAAVGHLRLVELDAAAVTTFLDSLPVTARTRLNNRLRLSKFFNWCRARKLIAINPCTEIQIRVRRDGDVSVLSVNESERLIRAAESSKHAATMVPFFALGLFGGLRSGEIKGVDWSAVDFGTRTINVKAETSKRRESRYVQMEPALVAFLKPHRKASGLICGRNFRRQWESVVRAHGNGDWSVNVCRHTALSMMLAKTQNRNATAEWGGTSASVLARHYRRPILKRDAQRFWNIRPA